MKKERNRKSVCNLLPEDELINRGVIFDQLPHLIMIYSGLSESKSDNLLRQERILRSDSELTSDAQFYRNIRDNSVTRDDIRKHLNKLTSSERAEETMLLLDSIANNPHSIGAWIMLSQYVIGAKSSNKDPRLQSYLDFILYLCGRDKKLIDEANTNLNYEKQYWLHLPGDHFNESADKKQAQYLIALILHWAALFEHFLIIDHPELVENTTDNGSPFTFNNYILKINQKGEVQHSVEIFLDNVKNRWSKEKYFKDKISWAKLSRDVAKAIADKNLEPISESIRKDFSRWRKGDLRLTIKSFKEKVAVLYGANDDFDELDSALIIIPFIQLFDSIQRELLKEGVPQEYIVKQFERYPIYLDLVSRRYKEFSEKKTVSV